MAIRKGYKVYVDVTVRFTEDGEIKPLSVIWEDGKEYTISRIKKCERAANLRAGGAGIMYTCVINGNDAHLYQEDLPSGTKWFLESKN